MLEFLRRNQVLVASAIFLSLSFALLSANRGGVRRFDPLGAIFLEILEPMQSVTATGIGGVGGLWQGYVSLIGVSRENRELRTRLAELEAERQRLLEIELENARLERLLDFRVTLPANALTARVVGKDASGWFETFILDRGENDGVVAGMAVVCADGVVGRIASTSPNASRVLLVSDHNSGVDALVQRSRARGILEGNLSGAATLKYVKPAESLEVGDVVVTSGLDGIFPKGLRLGRVVEVTRRESGLFQLADVAPFVDFSKLEEVLILTSPPREVNAVIEAGEASRLTEKAARALSAAAVAARTPAPAKPAPTPGRPSSRAPASERGAPPR
jgi:rod shape-determining protein MreC